MTRTLDAFPHTDADIPAFLDDLGLPGIVDLHVHAMPDRMQQAVWAFFDRLQEPAWPIRYREDEATRLAQLRSFGVLHHTALAYAHKPGMLPWLNDHTLALAEAHHQVIGTFTIFPDDDVEEQTAGAIARGARLVKVHVQVGRYDLDDPRLTTTWEMIASHRIPVMLHASAVYGVDGGGDWCGPAPVARLLDAHPDLRLVIAHLGRPDDDGFLTLAERTPGLLLDVSMALVHDSGFPGGYPQLERLAALSSRLVFGTDFPSIPHPYVNQIAGLAQLELADDDLREILHDRGLRLVEAPLI